MLRTALTLKGLACKSYRNIANLSQVNTVYRVKDSFAFANLVKFWFLIVELPGGSKKFLVIFKEKSEFFISIWIVRFGHS